MTTGHFKWSYTHSPEAGALWLTPLFQSWSMETDFTISISSLVKQMQAAFFLSFSFLIRPHSPIPAVYLSDRRRDDRGY